ncbi:MAG TPA: helix-turn-helix domain-containing protein [Cellulomonas sp.]
MTSEQPGRVRFLTVAEVAEVMRVSKMTVYRLLHSGEMPGVRVGRSFRVPQDALDHYLATARLDLGADDAGEDGPRAGRLSS